MKIHWGSFAVGWLMSAILASAYIAISQSNAGSGTLATGG